MGRIARNYIVRIYRLEKNSPRSLVGVIEEPEKEGKRAFTSLDELWGILNPGRRLKADGKPRIRGSVKTQELAK